MKLPKLVLLAVVLALPGCGGGGSFSSRQVSDSPAKDAPVVNQSELKTTNAPARTQAGFAQFSATNTADQVAQSLTPALERKIIRNGELVVEVDAPAEAQHKVGTIADSLGGFVVTSESKQRQTSDGKQQLEVKLVVRIPAAEFDAAMNQIRATGSRILAEKTEGQDVTEEFIDLEARLKTQKALEQQFLEIMKQARNVEDALSVQRQIAEVRTDIEKLEGHKRFLENRASLSTISVTLSSPGAIVVNTSGFGRSVREAVSESVEFAVAIVLFLIRFVIVMIPMVLLILLPLYFVGRFFFRRASKNKTVKVPAAPPPPTVSVA